MKTLINKLRKLLTIILFTSLVITNTPIFSLGNFFLTPPGAKEIDGFIPGFDDFLTDVLKVLRDSDSSLDRIRAAEGLSGRELLAAQRSDTAANIIRTALNDPVKHVRLSVVGFLVRFKGEKIVSELLLSALTNEDLDVSRIAADGLTVTNAINLLHELLRKGGSDGRWRPEAGGSPRDVAERLLMDRDLYARSLDGDLTITEYRSVFTDVSRHTNQRDFRILYEWGYLAETDKPYHYRAGVDLILARATRDEQYMWPTIHAWERAHPQPQFPDVLRGAEHIVSSLIDREMIGSVAYHQALILAADSLPAPKDSLAYPATIIDIVAFGELLRLRRDDALVATYNRERKLNAYCTDAGLGADDIEGLRVAYRALIDDFQQARWTAPTTDSQISTPQATGPGAPRSPNGEVERLVQALVDGHFAVVEVALWLPGGSLDATRLDELGQTCLERRTTEDDKAWIQWLEFREWHKVQNNVRAYYSTTWFAVELFMAAFNKSAIPEDWPVGLQYMEGFSPVELHHGEYGNPYMSLRSGATIRLFVREILQTYPDFYMHDEFRPFIRRWVTARDIAGVVDPPEYIAPAWARCGIVGSFESAKDRDVVSSQ